MLLAVKRTLNSLSMSMRVNEVLVVARWVENSRYSTEVAQHLFRTSQSHFRVCTYYYNWTLVLARLKPRVEKNDNT
jgi:hypothetical protein